MPSRDFPGSVPSCIMCVFTGDPGFVSLCITNPQEMFYCVSYVSSQEILALFECVLCMLGKHFTDWVTFPVQSLTVKNKQTSKQTMLRFDESVYSVPFLQTWKPPEKNQSKEDGKWLKSRQEMPSALPQAHLRSMGSGHRGKWNPIAPSCKDISVTRVETPTVRLRSPTMIYFLDLYIHATFRWARWGKAPSP